MGESSVRLRLPTLEIFASESGSMLSLVANSLTAREVQLARDVFGQSIDLDPVRIVQSSVVAAPTTLGNNIRTNGVMSDGTLIHELTHVWQYQNLGTRYISDSLYHQTVATFSSGSRNAAYQVRIVPGKRFTAYTAEQQAMIVQQWFQIRGLRSDPEYQRLIAEVRQARPLATNVRRKLILEEAAFGPGSSRHQTAPRRREYELQGVPNIPLIRLEF